MKFVIDPENATHNGRILVDLYETLSTPTVWLKLFTHVVFQAFISSLTSPSKLTTNLNFCTELFIFAIFWKLRAGTSSWTFFSATFWTASIQTFWNVRYEKDLTWLSMRWKKIFTTELFCRLLWSLAKRWTSNWFSKASSNVKSSRSARSNLIWWSPNSW